MKIIFSKSRQHIFMLSAFLIVLLVSTKTYAQFHIIGGFKYTHLWNFYDHHNQYVSSHYRYRPATPSFFDYWSESSPLPPGITIRAGSIRVYKNIDIDVEIGYGVALFGFKRIITANYIAGKKWRSQWYSSNYSFLWQYPINFYFLSKPTSKHFRKFIKIGGIFFATPRGDEDTYSVTKSIKGYPDADPNKQQDTIFETVYTYRVKPFPKLTVNAAIGIEKILLRKLVFDLSLVYNQGFSTLLKSDMEYTIEGETFSNRILNKGTYLGVELNVGYNFIFRGKENY